MPDLRELLHEATPAGEPSFDVESVAGRVAAADRRRRLTGAGLMAAVVVLVGLVVGNGFGSTETSLVDTPAGWPASATFAGAEVEVAAGVAPQDLFGTVEVEGGQVGVGVEADGRPVVWVDCGGEVARVAESADSDVLPLGAVVELTARLADDRGCAPGVPAGTPEVLLDGQGWLRPLAQWIDEAGLTACCASWPEPIPVADRPGVSGGGQGPFSAPEGSVTWGVVLDGEPLRFSADFLTWTPSSMSTPEQVPLGDGRAAVDAARTVVAFTCGMTTVQGSLVEDPLERWSAFAERLPCTPAPPEGTGGSSALTDLLADLGYEVVSTQPGAVVAHARVAVEGTELVVRSGGFAQVGLPAAVLATADLQPGQVASFTGVGDGFPVESSFAPVGGAYAVCTLTHAVFAADEPGRDHALALAEALAAHPGCDILGGFEEGLPPAPATSASVLDRVVMALQGAGLQVRDVHPEGTGGTLHFQPRQIDPALQPSPVWVSLAGPDAAPPSVDADTAIVPLADGEAVVLSDSGMISFTCTDVGPITTTGPGAGESELAWVEQLPQALGCDPRPRGLTVEIVTEDGTVLPRYESIREVRLARALDALGVEPCCGEPSHGGSGATTGMIWEEVPVAITAGPLIFVDPATQPGTDVVDLAGGQADRQNADVGNPVLRFDCGDTGYEMVEFLRNAADDRAVIAAAEALVDQLGCTPSIGQG